jgi:predicted Rossmann-fold nucleotide-binding protein
MTKLKSVCVYCGSSNKVDPAFLELATQMGGKAEERYWELFTADKMVASYVDLYRKLIKRV